MSFTFTWVYRIRILYECALAFVTLSIVIFTFFLLGNKVLLYIAHCYTCFLRRVVYSQPIYHHESSFRSM